MSCETLFLNINTLNESGDTLTDQAVAVASGTIAWCGSMTSLPKETLHQAKEVIEGKGKLLTPGLIDCHTHLVYAGDRSLEFKQRLEGRSYEDISRAGGGILSTVKATREASEQALLEQSLPRIKALAQEGVTTVEIKSGYGLDLDNEMKMLRVARQLGDITGLRVKTTFLGAHALPPEFQPDPQAYIDHLCEEVMPQLVDSGLVDAVDVFCESIGFTLEQTKQVFEAAKKHHISIKCHAEQLSQMGASALAARYGALSSDHLEYLDEAGVKAMAQSGTIAVLLPGAFYYLRECKKPPVVLFRQFDVPMALATDSNPGSSPTSSLLLMLNMGCQLFGLTVEEALAGVTAHAAKALGVEDKVGRIQSGLQADLVLWDFPSAASLCYYFAHPMPHRTMISGQWVTQ